MALCINQSGTWRNARTLCVNDSGTWRKVGGCINDSGTWRKFLQSPPPTTVGSSFGGGRAICISGGTVWVVAPNTTEVSRTWYCRNDANTTAQQVSGCTGWFVPTIGQLQNPGYVCRTYWDSYRSTNYWSSTENISTNAWYVTFSNGFTSFSGKTGACCVRAFRCVTY